MPGAPQRVRPRADDAGPDTPATYLGLVGKAFLTDQTQRVQLVAESSDYVPRFPDVLREIAAPMRRGREMVGVFDIEMAHQRYYTVADRSWVEFFADRASSALNTVEIAVGTLRQVRLKSLLQRISEGIARLRAMDRHSIRDSWHSLRQELLNEISDITGATKVTIFSAVNMYDAEGNLDLEHGQLVEATSSPRHRQKGDDRYFFNAQQNIAGLVLRTQERILFNRLLNRPPEFSPLPDQQYEVKSGVALPIMEGVRVVGVIQFDSDRSGFCTEENIASAEEAAQMAGDILVASRIRLDEIQVRYLREYELNILSLNIPDAREFMLITLQTLRRISNVVDGWGQVILLRNYRMDDGSTSLRLERVYETEFGEERPTDLTELPVLVGEFLRDHPTVSFELFREVIRTQRMRVLLDAQRLSAADRSGLSWDTARSIICVPLVQPRSDENDLEVFGLLVVTSRRATRFNDNDLSIVSRLARSFVIGYRNLGLANAQKDILEQLTHDLSKALVPLMHRVEDLAESAQSLGQAVSIDDRAGEQERVHQVQAQIASVHALVNLSRDLILWSIDLTDKELIVADEPIIPLPMASLVQLMEPRMNVLAQILSGSLVLWHYNPHSEIVGQGGPTREKLMKATLFKYIENALKYGRGDVQVTIQATPGWVVFEVQNSARVIPPGERGRIFEMGFRGTNVNPNLPGSGIGLFQVRRTAEILGGRVDYRAEGSDTNIFILELPLFTGSSAGKEAQE